MRTTVGQLLVNDALPEEMRDYGRVLDGKSIPALLRQVAEKYPEQYKSVSHKLSQLGARASQEQGGLSFGIKHLRKSDATKRLQDEIKKEVSSILRNTSLTSQQKNEQIILAVGRRSDEQQKQILAEATEAGNPLATQVTIGARGKPMNLASLLGGDLLYTDHRGNVIPIPVMRSYSQGLSPAEHWAGTYGARKGIVDTKQATAQAGFLCLAEGTPVRLPSGDVKAIESLDEGELVLGSDVNGNTFPIKVNAVFDNGPREVWRYYFRTGKSRKSYIHIDATEQHNVLAQLKRGRIGTPNGDRRSTTKPTKLPIGSAYRGFSLVPVSTSCENYGRSESHAMIIGWLIGDGGLSGSNINGSSADLELIRFFNAKLVPEGFELKQVTNHKYEYVLHDTQQLPHTRDASGRITPGFKHRLRKKLDELGLLGKLAQDKAIPRDVYGWNNASVADLMAGLFEADGCVAVSNNSTVPVIVLAMTSRQVVATVRDLLSFRFGIHASAVRTTPACKINNANYDLHIICINDRSSVKKFANIIKMPGVKGKKLNELLGEMQPAVRDDKYAYSFVRKEFLGILPTYDIEVDHHDHLFVLGNGAIVSNSKQLAAATHRLLIADRDSGDYDPESPRGMITSVDDADNEGSLLARDTGPYKRNTPLTPKVLQDLKSKGVKNILIRSPIVGGSPEGGVYAYDVGVRDGGRLPAKGEFVGIQSAGALSEPLSQGMLCLAEGTLVRMADFSVARIENIRPGDWVLGADKYGKTFPVQVVRHYNNGLKDCVETLFNASQTKQQVSLVSTLDHKVLAKVIRWHPKRVVNEYGLFPVGEKCVNLCPFLTTDADNSHRSLTEPMALLLGILLGDGCYTPSVTGVHLSCYDPSMVEHIKEYLADFGLKATKLKYHKGYYRLSQLADTGRQDATTGRMLSGTRNPIKKRLQELNLYGKYAPEKVLPSDIWSWDDASVLALIAGLYATDGSIYHPKTRKPKDPEPWYIQYGSTSYPLAATLKEILSVRFAVHSSSINSQPGKRKNALHSFCVSRQQDVARLATLLHPHMIGVKRAKFAEAKAATSTRNTQYFYRKQQRSVGRVDTYDIEVDHPDHLFVLANGLIVSNSSKHSGGVAGQEKTTGGFAAIDALVQVPQKMPGGAAHAIEDGYVDSIVDAPVGGQYLAINGVQHYIPTGRTLNVKKGDLVEAGDVLTDGLPNPAIITEHKGIGEGRRYFTDIFKKTMRDSGINVHRRNVELLARGLLNHVQLTDETDNNVPDDIVPYSTLEHTYTPRQGHTVADVKHAVGKYLERPVLHYTIGTKVRPSVLRNLQEFGVRNVMVHDEPPPFQPHMVRGMYQMQHDPDFLTQMYGSGLKKSLLTSTARGGTSQLAGSSFVPSLAATTDFGSDPSRMVYKPEARKPLEAELDLPPAGKQANALEVGDDPYESPLGVPDPSKDLKGPLEAPKAPTGEINTAAANPYTSDSSPTPATPAAPPNPYSAPAPPAGSAATPPADSASNSYLSPGGIYDAVDTGLTGSLLGGLLANVVPGYANTAIGKGLNGFISRAGTPVMIAVDAADTGRGIYNKGWDGQTEDTSSSLARVVYNVPRNLWQLARIGAPMTWGEDPTGIQQKLDGFTDYALGPGQRRNSLETIGAGVKHFFSPVSTTQAAAGTITDAVRTLNRNVVQANRGVALNRGLNAANAAADNRASERQLKERWAQKMLTHTPESFHRPGTVAMRNGRWVLAGADSAGGPQLAPGIPDVKSFYDDQGFNDVKFDEWVRQNQAASEGVPASKWYESYSKALANHNSPTPVDTRNMVHRTPDTLRSRWGAVDNVQRENATKLLNTANSAAGVLGVGASKAVDRLASTLLRRPESTAVKVGSDVSKLLQAGVQLPRL